MRISTHRKVSVALTLTIPKTVKRGELKTFIRDQVETLSNSNDPDAWEATGIRAVITDWPDGVTTAGKKKPAKGKPAKGKPGKGKPSKKAVKAVRPKIIRKRRAKKSTTPANIVQLQPLAAAEPEVIHTETEL